MKMPLEILSEVRIAAPCPVAWETMRGDEQVRHCDQCDRRVYNLSKMSAVAAVKLLQEREGSVCVQVWRRRDGTVLTTDCPVGVRSRVKNVWRRVATFAASVLAIGLLAGCKAKPEPTMGQLSAPPEDGECQRTGGVLPPPAPGDYSQ